MQKLIPVNTAQDRGREAKTQWLKLFQVKASMCSFATKLKKIVYRAIKTQYLLIVVKTKDLLTTKVSQISHFS